jgi:hypothetical protein
MPEAQNNRMTEGPHLASIGLQVPVVFAFGNLCQRSTARLYLNQDRRPMRKSGYRELGLKRRVPSRIVQIKGWLPPDSVSKFINQFV